MWQLVVNHVNFGSSFDMRVLASHHLSYAGCTLQLTSDRSYHTVCHLYQSIRKRNSCAKLNMEQFVYYHIFFLGDITGIQHILTPGEYLYSFSLHQFAGNVDILCILISVMKVVAYWHESSCFCSPSLV